MKKQAIMVSWDWRDQPDWEKINKALKKFAKPIIVPVPDTGSDSFVAAIANRPFSEEDAQAFFDRWLNE